MHPTSLILLLGCTVMHYLSFCCSSSRRVANFVHLKCTMISLRLEIVMVLKNANLLSTSSSTGSKYRADFYDCEKTFLSCNVHTCVHCLYLVSAVTGLAVASCVCTMFCAFHWMKKVCLTASVMFSIFLIG